MAPRDLTWTQDGNYTAAEDRLLLSAIFGGRHFVDLAPGVSKVDAGGAHGVVGSGDMAVTAGAGHTVNVAAGVAVMRGTEQSDQGTYLGGNDAAYNVACGSPDATNSRYILIQARATDTEYGAGASAFVIDAKIGTPSGAPVVPTPDENALVLAEILQPAAAASAASYTIVDRRTRAYALGGIVPVLSTTRPNPAYEGQFIYETNTDRVWFYTGSAWQLSAAAKTPYCVVSRVANQTIVDSTTTTISFDTETSDAAGVHASGLFTIPTGMAGAWDLATYLTWDSNATGRRFTAYNINGGTDVTLATTSGEGAAVLGGMQPLILAVGDVVRVRALQTSGADRTVTGTARMIFRGWA